jgi:putative transcriptional regulator
MPIVITIDGVLAKRRMKAKDLAAAIDVSETHLSLFRTGKVKGVRFSTLAKLCAALDCQPGDILSYEPGEEDDDLP